MVDASYVTRHLGNYPGTCELPSTECGQNLVSEINLHLCENVIGVMGLPKVLEGYWKLNKCDG